MEANRLSAGKSTLEVLLAIWQELLGKPLGPESHFFHEGGDSLLAVRMFVEIEARLGVQLPLSLLIQAPTASALAQAIEEAQGDQAVLPTLAEADQLQPRDFLPPVHIPIEAVEMGLDRWFEQVVQ